MAQRLHTGTVEERHRFDYWRHVVDTYVARCEIAHLDRTPPRCGIEARRVGDVTILNSFSSPVSSTRIEHHIRSDDNDALSIAIVRRGMVMTDQDDRRIRRPVGAIVISDMSRPYRLTAPEEHEMFGFGISRTRVERLFGSSRRYTLLPIGEAEGSVPIAGFLFSLYDNLQAIDPARAGELADMGVEMILGGLAKRLASDAAVPRSAALTLHRAQAFITGRLADPNLTAGTVAAALGISVRTLQTLFRTVGTSPAHWLWQRRLECARDRLASPDFEALSIGDVAYGCGFVDQGHFSRRFKTAFGVSPREWRSEARARRAA